MVFLENLVRMMNKLLIFSNANGYGGAEKSLELIVEELSKSYNIDILVENEEHNKNLSSNVNIISMPKGKNIFSTFKALFMIIILLMKNNYSNVLVNTNKGAFFTAILVRLGFLRNKNILIYVRDFQWKYQQFIFNSLKSINHKYLLTTKAFFDYKSFFSENITNYKIIPNFVKEPNIIEKTIIDKKIILLPAMINRWKGVEYLIEAANLLKKKLKFEVWVIGKVIDKEYFKELNLLVDKYELKNCVKFLPYTSDLSCYYSNADVVVNTSISEYGGPETFGRTLIEAWSYSKPVISFDCGGPKYLIQNGINGFLVKEKDYYELSKIIINTVYTFDLMNEKCYLTFQNKFSTSAVIGKLNALFI